MPIQRAAEPAVYSTSGDDDKPGVPPVFLSRPGHLPVGFRQVERIGMEIPSEPLPHLAILGMEWIQDRLEKLLVAG